MQLMKKTVQVLGGVLLLVMPLLGQGKRLWVLQAPGEMVEYDPVTFAVKEKVQLPTEALKSPDSIRINHIGQILYATLVPLPLAAENVASVPKVWLWNGHSATMIDSGITREVSVTGSNQAITEIASVPFLSADGRHLFWFANRARRLERENIDLSTCHYMASVAHRSPRKRTRGRRFDQVSGLPLRDRNVRGILPLWRVLGSRERRGKILSHDGVCRRAD